MIDPGQRFGRLVVLRPVDDSRKGRHYLVQCDCGSMPKVVLGTSMLVGRTKGCGCLGRESKSQHPRGLRHGGAVGKGTPTYRSWCGMRERCLNRRNHKYPIYGGRGITICARWEDFENFLADMGERPEGRSIDRIDNDGPYSPENCRWATATEQNRNRTFGRARG